MDVKVFHDDQSDCELHLPLGRCAPRLVQSMDHLEEYIQVHAPDLKDAILLHLGRLAQREMKGVKTQWPNADIAFLSTLSSLSPLGSESADLVRLRVELLVHLVGVDASAGQSERRRPPWANRARWREKAEKRHRRRMEASEMCARSALPVAKEDA